METREATIADLQDVPAVVLGSYVKDLPAWIVDWLFHSNHPLAINHRKTIKARSIAEAKAAGERQKKLNQHMKDTAHLIDPKSPIRSLGIIDPWIAQDFRNRYGSECLNDREFLDHCRKHAPELFYPT